VNKFSSFASQSPAIVISIAALFFSLGSGVSYAAMTSARSSGPAIAHSTKVKWVALSLIDGWKSEHTTDPGLGAPSYGANGTGVIYLSGDLSRGKSGEAFAVLPVGNRPRHTLYFPMETYGTTEGTLEIDPNGHMVLFGSDSTQFSSLAGINFPLGN
jgi:hypothetical protein